MILIEGPLEGSIVRASGCAQFILVEIGVVEIIIMEILLLSPDAPCSIGQSTKQKSTTNAPDHTSNGLLSRVAETSRASSFAVSASQRSWIHTCGDWNYAAAGACDLIRASTADGSICRDDLLGGTGGDQSQRWCGRLRGNGR